MRWHEGAVELFEAVDDLTLGDEDGKRAKRAYASVSTLSGGLYRVSLLHGATGRFWSKSGYFFV